MSSTANGQDSNRPIVKATDMDDELLVNLFIKKKVYEVTI